MAKPTGSKCNLDRAYCFFLKKEKLYSGSSFRPTDEVMESYIRPGIRIENTLQTNGVLIEEEWCRFLNKHNFLVDIRIDGPQHLHDAFRRDKADNSVYEKVVRSVRLMQEHKVEFNILCTVNAVNAEELLEVYRFFRDELRAQYIQFIPIFERDNTIGHQQGTTVTGRSVRPLSGCPTMERESSPWSPSGSMTLIMRTA